jgi:hypothetical protein
MRQKWSELTDAARDARFWALYRQLPDSFKAGFSAMTRGMAEELAAKGDGPAEETASTEIEEKNQNTVPVKAVVKGFTQEQLEYLREMSRHKQQMDWQVDLLEAKRKGIAIGQEQGQQKLIDLLESVRGLVSDCYDLN